MTVLSTKSLEDLIFRPKTPSEQLIITPLEPKKQIGDSAIDVRLGTHFVLTRIVRFAAIEAQDKNIEHQIGGYQEKVYIPFGNSLMLHPGSLVLGVTLEYIRMPLNIHAEVFTRSSWGRLGLLVATATVVHPGFIGCLTLELVNHGTAPIALYPGSRVGQMIFHFLDEEDKAALSALPSSKYLGLTTPAFSQIHKERKELERWHEISSFMKLSKPS